MLTGIVTCFRVLWGVVGCCREFYGVAGCCRVLKGVVKLFGTKINYSFDLNYFGVL